MSNQRGSVLISTMIIFSVVIVLAGACINVCIASYKINEFSIKSKQVFYTADSGVDIVYAKAINHLKNASTIANEKVVEYAKNKEDINDDELDKMYVDEVKSYFKNSLFINEISKDYKNIDIRIIDDYIDVNRDIVSFDMISSSRRESIMRSVCATMDINIPNKGEINLECDKDMSKLVDIKQWYIRR